MEDLENAISHLQEALPSYPPTHAEREVILARLSDALDFRYQHSEESRHLEASIAFFRDELDSRLPGDPDRADLFNGLIFRLLHCYDQFEESDEALLEALSRSQRDVALLAPEA